MLHDFVVTAAANAEKSGFLDGNKVGDSISCPGYAALQEISLNFWNKIGVLSFL